MQYIMLLPVSMLIILGIIFSMGKGAFLIAGFNTMPKSEQEKYDTVAMCRFMGKMMFVLAFGAFLWFLSQYLGITLLFFVGMGIFMAAVVFMIIYMNTGHRFRK